MNTMRNSKKAVKFVNNSNRPKSRVVASWANDTFKNSAWFDQAIFEPIESLLNDEDIIGILKLRYSGSLGTAEVTLIRHPSIVQLKVSLNNAFDKYTENAANDLQMNGVSHLASFIALKFEGARKFQTSEKQQVALVTLGLLAAEDLDHACPQARSAVLERDLGL